MRKKGQRISIFLGIFIILVLCGTLFFLRSDAFLNWLETRLALELESRIAEDYTAEVGDIKGSIFGNVTIIDGVKISKEGEPVISTGNVVLKYNWLGLLTRKFEVKELGVIEPEIHAKHDPDGTFNLSNILRADPSSDDAPQFGFAIENVELDRGKINYTDIQRGLEISVEGIRLTLEGPLDTWHHKGDLSIKTGSFKFNGSETPIDTFEVAFEILTRRSHFDIFRLDFGNSRVVAAGQLPYSSTGKPWGINLDFQRLDVADIGRFFGEGTELEGIVKGQITANGTDSGFAATLSVETPTLSITQAENDRHIALTALKVDANFNLHPIPTFTLKTFNAQIADGTLTGSGSIGLQNRPDGDVIAQLQQLTTHPLVYTGEWAATDVQLIPLLAMFVQLPEFLVDSTGHLSGNATFNGSSAAPSTLHLNSKIEITETVLRTVAFADSTLSCTIDAGELKVDGNLDETEVNITGPFPLGEQDALELRMSGINFDDLMQIVDSADIGGTGEYTAQLSLDGTLAGSLKIPNASFNDIPIGVLVGNLDYQEGQVFIENGLLTKNTQNDIVTAYQSRTTITGVVDVEGDFPAEFSIGAAPIYVEHYPKILLGADYPVEGEIRGELTLNGTLINLDGSADFSVTEGVAWGIHLDPLTLPLRIEDYNIDLPNFEITTHGQKVTLNVSVASNADYDLLLESDAPVNLQALANTANISDFPFGGQFDVRVVGTLKKPESADFQIELDFSDITFLDAERETQHPLGDASLHGRLVELKNVTGEPDRFDFTGSGFNGQIQGYVRMDSDNSYEFEVESEALEVKPILRILHPALEAITGTAKGRAAIKGTVADLASRGEENSRQPSAVSHQIETEIEGGKSGREEEKKKLPVFQSSNQILKTQSQRSLKAIRRFTPTMLTSQLTPANWTTKIQKDTRPHLQMPGTFDCSSQMTNGLLMPFL